MPYPELRNFLASVFSAEVGHSEEQQRNAANRYLDAPEMRRLLLSELACVEAGRGSWADLLENEHYCVTPTDSEEEAREYIMKLFGTRLINWARESERHRS